MNGDAVNVLIENRATSESNLYAYCRNSCVIYADYYGFGRTVLRAAPKCPPVIGQAIINSGLHRRRGSIFEGSRHHYSHSTKIGNHTTGYTYTYCPTGSMLIMSTYVVVSLTNSECKNYLQRKSIFRTIVSELNDGLTAFNEASPLMAPPLPDWANLLGFASQKITSWLLASRTRQRIYYERMIKQSAGRRIVDIPIEVCTEEKCYFSDWNYRKRPYWHTMRQWKYVPW